MPTIFFKNSDTIVTFSSDDGKEVSLLREAIRSEAGVPYRCGGGICGTCKVKVEEGMENLSKIRKPEIKHLGDAVNTGYRLACQTFTSGDCVLSWREKESSQPQSDRLKEYWLKEG